MSVYLCMKAALTEPRLLEKSFDFMVASATYLTHVATSTNMDHLRPISFPLPEQGTQLLKSVPEYVAENAMEFMVFLKRFKDSMYEVGRGSFFNGGVGLVLQTCLLFRIGRKPSAFEGQLPTSRIFTKSSAFN